MHTSYLFAKQSPDQPNAKKSLSRLPTVRTEFPTHEVLRCLPSPVAAIWLQHPSVLTTLHGHCSMVQPIH